jgi:hypothetical protein
MGMAEWIAVSVRSLLERARVGTRPFNPSSFTDGFLPITLGMNDPHSREERLLLVRRYQISIAKTDRMQVRRSSASL